MVVPFGAAPWFHMPSSPNMRNLGESKEKRAEIKQVQSVMNIGATTITTPVPSFIGSTRLGISKKKRFGPRSSSLPNFFPFLRSRYLLLGALYPIITGNPARLFELFNSTLAGWHRDFHYLGGHLSNLPSFSGDQRRAHRCRHGRRPHRSHTALANIRTRCY